MDEVDVAVPEEEAAEMMTELSNAEEARLDSKQDAAMDAMLDDDANRCTIEEVDEPVEDDSRKGDNAISKKLGYNRFMVENV